MNEAEEKRMREAFAQSCVDEPFGLQDMALWADAWQAALAYQDKLIRAAYADAAKVAELSTVTVGNGFRTRDGIVKSILLRTPDDARRKLDEMKK